MQNIKAMPDETLELRLADFAVYQKFTNSNNNFTLLK